MSLYIPKPSHWLSSRRKKGWKRERERKKDENNASWKRSNELQHGAGDTRRERDRS